MTHLKKLFYQDYFSFSTDKRDSKSKPVADQTTITTANHKLLAYRFNPDKFPILDLEQEGKNLTKINLITTYPGLFTGSGYMHETGSEGEFKLGFYFDHTTGLPIIPGHSVKGTLRSLFPNFRPDTNDYLQIAKEQEEIKRAKSSFIADLFSFKENYDVQVHHLELAIFEGVDITKTLGKRKEKGEGSSGILCYLPMSKHDQFLDTFIYKSYNSEKKILGSDAITPHGDNPLKNPIPLPFLKVLPEVGFTFPFILHDTELGEGQDLKIDAQTKRAAFESILKAIGIGAKTNVGYGQLISEGEFTERKKSSNDENTSRRNNNRNKRKEQQSGKTNTTQTLGEIEKDLPYEKLKSDEKFGRVLDPKANRKKEFGDIKRLYFLPDGRDFPNYRADILNIYERKTILKVRIIKDPERVNVINKIEIIEKIYPHQ